MQPPDLTRDCTKCCCVECHQFVQCSEVDVLPVAVVDFICQTEAGVILIILHLKAVLSAVCCLVDAVTLALESCHDALLKFSPDVVEVFLNLFKCSHISCCFLIQI